MPGETARLCAEAVDVLVLRGRLLIGCGPRARAEAAIMVAEKYAAAWMLTARLVTGRLGTAPAEIAHETVRFHRRWVRANRKRLRRG